MDLIRQACRDAGGQRQAAELIGVTVQAVSQWISTGRVPPERVLALEAACGGTVTRYQLRPDIFGPDPAKVPATDRATAQAQ